MFLHRSNRAEVLVAKLADVVATPVGGPFEGECIVVQGKGMERWLTMELSKRHGVWANPDFPFARGIVERAFAAVLPDEGKEAWDSSGLTWAVAKGLLEHANARGFEPIDAYLRGDVDHRKLLQLSERVASLFDGYAIYRPELLTLWQEESGPGWQPQLWNALTKNQGFAHIGTREAEFVARLQDGTGPIEGLPQRISLFGISALPPLYLRVFAQLASRIEVNLFLLSPSQEYWVDIRSRREVLREELDINSNEELEVGNELLATLGRLHRDFQYLLESEISYLDASEQYVEPDTSTLLGVLQADILSLYDRPSASDKLNVLPGDDSLSVHSCHGPTRELEVLRDQITARLEADPTLEARDIIVMTPDIESYAPFIDAVFSERGDSGDVLPFHIADRVPRAAYPVVDAFARLLELIPTRLTGPALLDFLSTEVVRERFSIEAEELPVIQNWIWESNIRWASDASHREFEGQPATDLNTWKFGLDRMLLGYASPSNGTDLFGGALAYDDVEGGIADLLGRFADFCESVFALQVAFRNSHRVSDWQPILERALFSILRSDDDCASQHQMLRESFAELRDYSESYGFDKEISLSALLPILEGNWLNTGTRSNFLSGGVSFCQLMPMRSIPHRVVCIVGMNDGAFPKNSPDLSFDLVTQHPRLGDRRPRDDDRYLFLEALLSARDALIITFAGQHSQTNAALPASVLVEQLIAIAEQSTEGHSVLVRHPLQAFSPRYFSGEDERLFRYSKRDCAAAQTLANGKEDSPLFLSEPILDKDYVEGEVRDVALADFLAFFTQTAKHFLTRRVGMRLQEDQEELAVREPMELEGLARWHVGDRLLAAMLETGDPQRAMDVLRASGALPLGTPGGHHLRQEIPLIEAIVAMAKPFRTEAPLPNLEVDVTVGTTRILGQIGSLWPSARQEISYSSISGKRELRAWLQHLLLCHQDHPGYPRESVAIGRDVDKAKGVRFVPVQDAHALLVPLVALYEAGQAVPLPLFPQASPKFAKSWIKAKEKDSDASIEDSLSQARAVYLGSGFGQGPIPDIADAYVRQLYGTADPIAEDFSPLPTPLDSSKSFSNIATTIFGPLMAHMERIK
tara:strand:+ start:138355 stop:141633 length:3279 start_codon:yes stop_codon:yes gene_type:complete